MVSLVASWSRCFAAQTNANSSPDALALLEAHCVRCHGGEKTKGGFDLTTREALLRGGETGPAVVPGNPGTSLLVRMIRHEVEPEMPHKEKKLPDEAITRIAEWVKNGAPYDRRLSQVSSPASPQVPAEFTLTEADRQHWAFQPVRRPALPVLAKARSASGNPIDHFILAALETNGLSFSPAASRTTLIRRVTFDLIGLPPTPAEIDAFVNDRAANAYERLIDRLLASPHYGERWGRHWLDLARFAETDGFEHDLARPHAWRYRDYVIRAFNTDKPYDRFMREQMAGDELWPRDPDALIATGFNLLGPDMVDSSDQVQRRHNTLNDMTDTVALTFLGLTLGCARCHDHKFEPLSQRDYYRLQACFTPAEFRREQVVATADERALHDEETRRFEAQPPVRELAELETPARLKLRAGKLAKLSPEARAAHQVTPAQRNPEQANLVLETEGMLAVSDKELIDALMPPERERRVKLLAEIQKLVKPVSLPKSLALGRGDGAAPKTFVLRRGEYTQPGEAVEAGFPGVLNPPSLATSEAAGRRAALADWLASPANPLTARVMVNRLWQHHFGRGLVPTPSDFGTHGQRPTHPALLDWLAAEFMSDGWSVKRMHKLMLLSVAYQQTSEAAAQIATAGSVDPGNRLYWRMNRQRLEGEVIRDSLLAISGRLNPKLGGPGVYPAIPEDIFKGASGWTISKDPRERDRRSIYIFVRRNLRFPFLEVFDAPDNNLSCPSRERSTTAPQALTLLNADEVTSAAEVTARRLAATSGTGARMIDPLYRLALGRAPTASELAVTTEFLQKSPPSELCRALFNLNDFVYVE